MVKYLIIFSLFFLYGCETNSEQVIENEYFSFDDIKFNAVSKKLIFNNHNQNDDIEIVIEKISSWFNNKIKLDGFEGELELKVNTIEVNKIKKDQFYKYQIELKIEFTEKNQVMNFKKTYNLNSIEYGTINGDFTINDQERLNINIINKSLESITNKMLSISN